MKASDLEYQRKLVELKVQHAGEVYGFAAAYDNAIILGGYAAFFGLWAGLSGELTPVCRAATAALMGISLMAYIVWHVAQMLNRQRFEGERAAAFDLHKDPPAFLAEWEAIRLRYEASWVTLIRYWRPAFLVSLGAGMLGAGILVWNAAAFALNLPLQLRG
ncbi:MAG TPA: hypothetical protein VEZ70_14435 [Allosphingosinicella sp.]|nr:hypothetical protein [Allosphingosinicella sp.]